MKRLQPVISILLAAIIAVSLPCAFDVHIYHGFAAKSVKDLQSEYSDMEKELKQLQKDIEFLQSKEQSYTEQIALYNKQVSLIEDQIDSVNNQITMLDENIANMSAQITELDTEIAALNEEIAENYELFKQRLKAFYLSGEASELEILLSSSSFADFLNRYSVVTAVAERDKALMDSLSQDIANQEDRLRVSEQNRIQLEDDIAEAKKLQNELQNKQDELQDKITDTEKLIKKIKNDQSAKEKAIKELDESMERLEKDIEEAIKNSTGQYVGGTMLFPCPAGTRISSKYGYRNHPITGDYKLHKGIDIAASKNSSILAANYGKVTLVKNDANGYGQYVIVDHGGGILTLYAHCNKILVSKGDAVKRGQEIAKVGSTGSSTGNHLHFEIREDGKAVDPTLYKYTGQPSWYKYSGTK